MQELIYEPLPTQVLSRVDREDGEILVIFRPGDGANDNTPIEIRNRPSGTTKPPTLHLDDNRPITSASA